jgi:hypothetical protein
MNWVFRGMVRMVLTKAAQPFGAKIAAYLNSYYDTLLQPAAAKNSCKVYRPANLFFFFRIFMPFVIKSQSVTIQKNLNNPKL